MLTELDIAVFRELSDADIVARVLRGDTALFELIMRRYNQRLYRVASAILGVDQYLNFPQDATLGEINRTLVNFSDIVSALDRSLEITVAASNAPSSQMAADRSLRGAEMDQTFRRRPRRLGEVAGKI